VFSSNLLVCDVLFFFLYNYLYRFAHRFP
jgi:hypothetical protein